MLHLLAAAAAAPPMSALPVPLSIDPQSWEVSAAVIRTDAIPYVNLVPTDVDPSDAEDFPEPEAPEIEPDDEEADPEADGDQAECTEQEARGRALLVDCGGTACAFACEASSPAGELALIEVDIRRSHQATTIAEFQHACGDDTVLHLGDLGASLANGVYATHVRSDDDGGEWQQLVAMLRVKDGDAQLLFVEPGAAGVTSTLLQQMEIPAELHWVLDLQSEAQRMTFGPAILEQLLGVLP